MLRPLALAICAFLSLVSYANAQDISANMAVLKVGDYFVYRVSDGKVFTQRFAGKKRGNFVMEVYEDTDLNSKPITTFHTDKNGQNVLRIDSMGRKERFAPHDCRRTVGRCQMTYTNKNGERLGNLSVIKGTPKGFESKSYDSKGKLYQTRRYLLDSNGFAKSFTIIRPGQVTERYKLVATNR